MEKVEQGHLVSAKASEAALGHVHGVLTVFWMLGIQLLL
jgi:hypothetical protein